MTDGVRFEVLTTEKVPFSYRVAGMGSRFLAWLADAGVIILLIFAGSMTGSVLEAGREGLGAALQLLWQFAVTWGYFLFFEWLWHGQTPGKRLLGIRVIGWDGTSVTFFQSAVRNIVRVVDALPFFYGLGFLVAANNRLHRRLGDWAAGTLVVHIDRKAGPIRVLHEELVDAGQSKEGQLRQRLGQLSRAQKQTLLDLCLRREQLRITDRAQLFRAEADYFRHRLELSSLEHESDEKFVVRLAGILGSSLSSR